MTGFFQSDSASARRQQALIVLLKKDPDLGGFLISVPWLFLRESPRALIRHFYLLGDRQRVLVCQKGRRSKLPKIRQKRITLSDATFTALDNMVAKINLNFHGGSIYYSQLMGWIVRYFETASLESKIDTIRAAHFDKLVYMRHLVAEEAKARRDGGVVGATPDLMKKLIEQKR